MISPFASALKSIIEPNIDYWSESLGVTKSTINQWFNDVDIPSSMRLYLIIREVEGGEGTNEEWEKIKNQKLSQEITPLYTRFRSTTLQEYVLHDLYEAIEMEVRTLNLEPKADYLIAIRKLITTIKTKKLNMRDLYDFMSSINN